MRCRGRAHHSIQLDLFRGEVGREPDWRRLPTQARETAMRLIAQMLSEHAAQAHAGQPAGGREHE